MKRPMLITVVNVLQFLLGLSLAGLTVYLLTLTRSRDTLADPDAADTVHGLLIGALVLGIPALITLIAVWGLWKRRFWGWVLSLATDVGMLAVFLYSLVDENSRDADDVAMALAFVAPIVLLLLPAVKKHYWSTAASQSV
jgi:hypothetical protein